MLFISGFLTSELIVKIYIKVQGWEQKLPQYNISDDYTKTVGSSCRLSNAFGKIFNHLSEAKISCNSDKRCIGIFEQSCDNSGPFHLCKEGFETSEIHIASCFYQKKNYSGMYLL